MKKLDFLYPWMAIVILGFIVGCSPDDNTPPAPTPAEVVVKLLPASQVTATSVVLSAEVSGETDKITFLIKQEGKTLWCPVRDIPKKESGIFKMKITYLFSGTKYWFRVQVGDKVSDSLSFVTRKNSVALFLPTEYKKVNSVIIRAKILSLDTTTVTLSYGQKGEERYLEKRLPLPIISHDNFDTIVISFPLPNLSIQTDYNLKLKLVSRAGEYTFFGSLHTYNLTDYDGNMYDIASIGQQFWLKENFRGTHFSNGDAIPIIPANIGANGVWQNLTTPAMCYYNNNPANGPIYGALYNGYVMSDPRPLIKGFHTPSLDEWKILVNSLGGGGEAGGRMGPGTEFNASYSGGYGYDGLLDQLTFGGQGGEDDFWSSTEMMINVYYTPGIGKGNRFITLMGGDYVVKGLSIRLIRDE